MSQAAAETVAGQEVGRVEISRADAELILDALRTMLNLRRYSFKEPGQDPRELYGDVADALARFRDQYEREFGKPAARAR